jgi:hypothetical protein
MEARTHIKLLVRIISLVHQSELYVCRMGYIFLVSKSSGLIRHLSLSRLFFLLIIIIIILHFTFLFGSSLSFRKLKCLSLLLLFLLYIFLLQLFPFSSHYSLPSSSYCSYFLLLINQRPPLWSSGQSSWLQIRRHGFDSRHYQKKQ